MKAASVASHPPVPGTSDDPWYAHYPVAYVYGTGTGRTVSTDSFEKAIDASDPWVQLALRRQEPLYAEHTAPDGLPVIRAAWAGGTWAGTCGSSLWIKDENGRLRSEAQFLAALNGTKEVDLFQISTSDDSVSRSQSWWLEGHRDEGDGWDGFRVECPRDPGHDDPCQVLDWTWDWQARSRCLPG